MASADDPALRRAALEALGAFGDALAREALETGALAVSDVLAWEGSEGRRTGVHVVLAVAPELRARVEARPAAFDALVAAVAAAVARAPDRSLVDLRVMDGARAGGGGSPYRSV